MQIVKINELVEGRPGDSQQTGGLGLIPAGLNQGLQDFLGGQGRNFLGVGRGQDFRG